MPSVPFTIADVFSTTPYKGNPLAIVDARDETLTDTQMKLITRQFNLSETTFFFPPTSSKADFKLRSFLPDGREVYGAGHNILGVWWHLANLNILALSALQRSNTTEGAESFVFHQELGGNVTPVKVTRYFTTSSNGQSQNHFSVSIRQAAPQSHSTHPDPAALAQSLGLNVDDIGFVVTDDGSGPNLQAQVMSTSTTRHLLVPISSVDVLNRVAVQRDKLLEQLRLVDDKAYGLYLFTPVPSADGIQTFQARFFSPGMSGEDPATGSAAGPLSVYLYNYGVLKLNNGARRIIVHQGLRVGRECVINVELSFCQKGGEAVAEVDLIGSAVQVAEGRIAIPNHSTAF